jgi:ADP-ribosylglycohydrolase
MGSATEMLTAGQICERFGYVTGFLAPGEDTFAVGRAAGQLTDDGLLTIALLDELAANNGAITADRTAALLLEWADDPEVFDRFAGPSSRKAILALRQGQRPELAGAPDPMANDLRISNGAAMKVAPAGWTHPGEPGLAVDLACVICVPTHNTNIAFAGAGAVAAAVAAASAGAARADVLEAALAGARSGDQVGLRRAVEVPGPSVEARIELALRIVDQDAPPTDRLADLASVIGSGLPITEAVPMAIGLVALFGDDPMELIRRSVNLGGDTDTVAAIAGAISGTMAGLGALDAGLVAQVEEANGIDIGRTGEAVAAMVLSRGAPGGRRAARGRAER